VLVAAVTLLFVLAWGLGRVHGVIFRPPLLLGQDAVVAGVDRAELTVELRREAGGFIAVTPPQPHTLLVFYPGGLVRPQAYEWLGVALAAYGVRTVIAVFPFDLAVASPERAGRILDEVEPTAGERVVLAGHSLGGAMAARFALRHPGRLDALVLMAAYSAESDDLSALALPTLVLAAEHDGLATLAQLEQGLERLPAGAQLTVLPGAVHSFFGRYGPQRGDGLPTVTRAEAEAAIVQALVTFLAELQP
jgi:pimeloyl-ACP methyl ester carboxylesterase